MATYTFAVSTTKGSHGTITNLDGTNTVGDLYREVQAILQWAPEENDFYIIILGGKKLTDETVLLATLKPNPTRAQIVATKLSKPSKRVTAAVAAPVESAVVPAPVESAVVPAVAPTGTTMVDNSSSKSPTTQESPPVEAASVKSTTTEAPFQLTTTAATATTTATTTTTTTTTPSTVIATKETPVSTMTDGPTESKETKKESTETTTSSSVAKKAEFDYNNTPKLDFVPCLSSEKTMTQFWEILDAINPDLVTELRKDPIRFQQFTEISTRNAKTPGFDAKVWTQEAQKVLSSADGAGGAAAGPVAAAPTAAQRQQLQQQQRQQQLRQLESQLDETDNANIDNLMALGFSKAQAIQAYLVCNKNPDLAANWLFTQME